MNAHSAVTSDVNMVSVCVVGMVTSGYDEEPDTLEEYNKTNMIQLKPERDFELHTCNTP